MKKVIKLTGFLMALLSVATLKVNAQEVNMQGGAEIKVDKEVHDYGTIEYGGNGQCTFTITNTGTTDLIITSAHGSCGCTVPTYSKEPIAPGKTTVITVNYDTKRQGPFTKTVTIMTNATNEPAKVVKIKGTVEAKPATETAPQGAQSGAPKGTAVTE